MTDDQDRLIAALTAPNVTPDNGYLTFREIARLLDMGDGKLRSLLQSLSDQGRLECKRVPRRTIAGDWQPVPGYRLAEGVTKQAD